MPVISVARGKTSKIRQFSQTLIDRFSQDELKCFCRALIEEKIPIRKPEMSEALANYLLDGGARSCFDQFSEIEKLAVGEALHSEDGYVPEKFEAMYGDTVNFGKYSSYNANPKITRLFFSYQSGGGYKVTSHLQEVLLKFVPKPKKARLAVSETLPEKYQRQTTEYELDDDDPGLFIHTRGQVLKYSTRAPKSKKTVIAEFEIETVERLEAAQSELFSMLQMIQQGKVAVSDKTNKPSPDMMWKILRAIGGDYYQSDDLKLLEQIGYIRPFAWIQLLLQAYLVEKKGKYLTLTYSGKQTFSRPVHEVVSEIWRAWQASNFDEFSRIDSIKAKGKDGKLAITNAKKRRECVTKTLQDCPVGKWIKFEDFSKYLKASGNLFEVTYDPRSLYVGYCPVSTLEYRGVSIWEIVDESYIRCVLLEYAATLGLIDVAVVSPHAVRKAPAISLDLDDILSRYDGLLYFRLTPLGAYCLGKTKTFVRPKAKYETKLQVLANMRINLVEGKLPPDCLAMIESFAEPIAENAWEISQTRCLEACENNLSVESFRNVLERFDDQPLPDKVEAFLAKIAKNADATMVMSTATVFYCKSKEIAEAIASHPQTKKLCQKTDHDYLVVYDNDLKAFHKALHILGYGTNLQT